MAEFKLLEEQSPPRIDLGDWALRLAVAALFVMFGSSGAGDLVAGVSRRMTYLHRPTPG